MIITIKILLFSHIHVRHIEPNWTCSWARFTWSQTKPQRVCGSLLRFTEPDESKSLYGSEPNRTGTGQNHAFSLYCVRSLFLAFAVSDVKCCHWSCPHIGMKQKQNSWKADLKVFCFTFISMCGHFTSQEIWTTYTWYTSNRGREVNYPSPAYFYCCNVWTINRKFLEPGVWINSLHECLNVNVTWFPQHLWRHRKY